MSTSPIDSLEELWKWKNRKDSCQNLQQLENFRPHSGPQILLCHDLRGGYLEEETKEGKKFEVDRYPYMFLNWWQIDIFNYFSHHLVTIPPEEYTRIAHKHGALSLGTFITEWIPGKKICSKILESEDTVERTVDCLVAVANHFGFDGWLINVENEIEKDRIALLIRFCSSLTEKSKESNPHSQVIWYDSVLHNGKLHWQNELNESNNKFYNACDAIYLNYNWKDRELLKSAEYGLVEKIFAGVDVWARGCIGEFKCYQPFAMAKLFHVSVALFAPGWIFEKFPEKNQIVEGIRFWSTLLPYVQTRKLSNANFTTNFCSGMDNNWLYRLSSVQLQPQCLDSDCYQVVGSGLTCFGRNRSFALFSFDSIAFRKIIIFCESNQEINFFWNETERTEKTEGSTWIISHPGILNYLEVRTTSHDETVIYNFTISAE